MNATDREALEALRDRAGSALSSMYIAGWSFVISRDHAGGPSGTHVTAQLVPVGRSSTEADWDFIGEAMAVLGAPDLRECLLTPLETTHPNEVHHFHWGGDGHGDGGHATLARAPSDGRREDLMSARSPESLAGIEPDVLGAVQARAAALVQRTQLDLIALAIEDVATELVRLAQELGESPDRVRLFAADRYGRLAGEVRAIGPAVRGARSADAMARLGRAADRMAALRLLDPSSREAGVVEALARTLHRYARYLEAARKGSFEVDAAPGLFCPTCGAPRTHNALDGSLAFYCLCARGDAA